MNNLNKYFDLNCDDLNIKFEGSYELLKWIIIKYEIYNSQVTKFITSSSYGISSSSSWRKNGVPPRVWNIMHKDLIMLRVTGKIDDNKVMNLEELAKEFSRISSVGRAIDL
jgi:hypothetical protein